MRRANGLIEQRLSVPDEPSRNEKSPEIRIGIPGLFEYETTKA